MTAKKPTLKQLVAFCVLIESGQGVISKSPDYILDKFELACMHPERLLPTLLDMTNKAKYVRYLTDWGFVE